MAVGENTDDAERKVEMGLDDREKSPLPVLKNEVEMDWKRLEVFSDGSAAGNVQFHAFLNLFIETSRTSLLEIQTRIEAGDFALLGKALHRLRGSCLTVGAKSMSQVVEMMELHIRDGSNTELTGLWEELENKFAGTREVFKSLIDGRIHPHFHSGKR